MNKKLYTTRFLLLAIAVLIMAASADAQRGRRNNRYNDYRYGYNYNRGARVSFSFPRSYISFGIGSPRYYNGSRYHYYRPYSSYYYRVVPPIGIHVSILPPLYRRIYVGPDIYYYYDGTYYAPYSSGGYSKVDPPLGAEVDHLPSGSVLKVIDGEKYYERNGSFYKELTDENGNVYYRVAGTDGVLNTNPANENYNSNSASALPKAGDRFDRLPDNSKAVIISSKKYYLSPDGVYFEEITEGNKTWYEVAGN